MDFATHSGGSHRGAPRAPAAQATAGLSLMLVNIVAARVGIARGRDPSQPLRSAILRIRELPPILALPLGDTVAAGFEDLCEYMCRQLGDLHDETAFIKLTDTCDLLREICRAWVTLPYASATMSTGEAHVRRL
jgi:hypothetical protein